jgi:hypothetical protein
MKKYSVIKILVAIVFLSSSIYSQMEKDTSFSTFEFRWSNDFVYQTDRYYTNGFAIEYLKSQTDDSYLNSILFPSKLNDKVVSGYTLIQDIYTPKAKFYIPDQLNGDRPFASYILFGLKKFSYNDKFRLKIYSEIQTGVLGPSALGEQTQNGIHSQLPSGKVNGWENQISNSFMLNYSVRVQKYLRVAKTLEISGFASTQVGLPFTNVGVGLQSRIGVFGLFPEEFKHFSQKHWEYYLTVSAQLNVIGYNATLQGGLLSESTYTLNSINRLVGKASVGINVKNKLFNLKYSQQFLTPEFSGAAIHSWGFLIIAFKL